MNHPHIGEVLRDYRKKNHLSVTQVVDILSRKYNMHISPKTLYSWENGKNQPSADSLITLCKLYNITNILKTLGYQNEKEPVPLILSEEEREIIIKYRSRNYCNSAIRKLLDIE